MIHRTFTKLESLFELITRKSRRKTLVWVVKNPILVGEKPYFEIGFFLLWGFKKKLLRRKLV